MLGEGEDESDCNSCVPAYLRDEANDGERSEGVVSLLGAALFFFLFLLIILGCIAFLVSRFFPGLAETLGVRDKKLRSSLGPPGSQKQLISLTLCATVILTAILTELILCEIARCLPTHVRSVATRATMLMLLVVLVLVSPALEIHTIVSSSVLLESGKDWRMMREGKRKVMYLFEGILMLGWLVGYWSVGSVLSTGSHELASAGRRPSLVEQYLRCTGVIGVCLMASLAGFAAVSSVWQTFGQKEQPITNADIDRKQFGLDAANEMLATKESRLRALDRKRSAASASDSNNNVNNNKNNSLISSTFSSIRNTISTRTNESATERRSLAVEINGLQRMRDTLSPELYALRTRRDAQLYATTPAGRHLAMLKRLFALYCSYRLGTTALAILMRSFHSSIPFLFNSEHQQQPLQPLQQEDTSSLLSTSGSDSASSSSSSSQSFTATSTDPITNILALLARHVDPALDRDAWSRQISFALSGAMLLASVSSAMQTFLLLARLVPAGTVTVTVTGTGLGTGTLMGREHKTAPANFLALLVSQVAATYVMASALLLRSNLPKEVGADISDALGIGLEPRFVEWWFESCFFSVAGLTAFGIWVERKVKGPDYLDLEDGHDD